MTAPQPGTPEHRWHTQGAIDEAEAREALRRSHGKPVKDLLDLTEAVAETHPAPTVGVVLEAGVRIFATDVTLRERRAIRRALRRTWWPWVWVVSRLRRRRLTR